MEDEGERRAKRLFPALDAPHEHEASRRVVDADEEIFLLYTIYAPGKDRRGLGQVNSNEDVLALTLDLVGPSNGFEVTSSELTSQGSDIRKATKGTTPATNKRKAKLENRSSNTLQVHIRQSSTSLRTDAGDTGSIIWRSSLSLAEKLIWDLERRDSRNRLAREPPSCLIAPNELLKCKVLELGSGTGVLPQILYAYIEARVPAHYLVWLATDQIDILPLLRKNLTKSKAFIDELDWMTASNIYRSHSLSMRRTLLKDLFKPFCQAGDAEWIYPDLIIATDCIFNPSLAQAFVDTLNLCSAPLKTVAMIVCELRESEMMSEFLSAWLKEGPNGEQWNINALSDENIVGRLASGSIVWVAWRSS